MARNQPSGGERVTDREMLRHVLDTILRIEKRLDDHIDDENDRLGCLRTQMTNMREELAGSRVKWAVLTSFVALTVSGAVAWVVNGSV
jgi:hypothetical protein